MAQITIDPDYDADFKYDGTNYTTQNYACVGAIQIGTPAKGEIKRCAIDFPLTSIPAGSIINSIDLYVYCVTASGSSSHLTDIHPYAGNAQPNVEDDVPNPQQGYTRCAQGTEYINDSDAFRTEGLKQFALPASAVNDMQNCLDLGVDWTIGFHEEGDNDNRALIYGCYGNKTYIVVNYTPPGVVPGYGYSDGLVCVQVAG